MEIKKLKSNLIYLTKKHVNDESIRNEILFQIDKYFNELKEDEFPQIKHIAYNISEHSKINDKKDISLMKEIGYYYL